MITDEELVRAYLNRRPNQPTPHINPRHLRGLQRVVRAYIDSQRIEIAK